MSDKLQFASDKRKDQVGVSGNLFHKPGAPGKSAGAKSTPRKSSASEVAKRLAHRRSMQHKSSKKSSDTYLS